MFQKIPPTAASAPSLLSFTNKGAPDSSQEPLFILALSAGAELASRRPTSRPRIDALRERCVRPTRPRVLRYSVFRDPPRSTHT